MANTLQDSLLLVMPILGDQHHDRLPDSFLGGVAEQTRGARIPARDRAIESLADDRVVGRVDDRCKPSARDSCLAAGRDVRNEAHDADDVPAFSTMRRIARMDPALPAVPIVD